VITWKVYFIRYKNFPKQTHLKIILSFDVIVGQKEVNMAFFEDLCFVRFCGEIIFENLKNHLENTKKEAF
jgi:hypothetical protein